LATAPSSPAAEQAFALADEDSPAFVPGVFRLATLTVRSAGGA